MISNYGLVFDRVLDGKANVLPFIEEYPLDKISTVSETVHYRRIARRVIVVRSAASLIRRQSSLHGTEHDNDRHT